MIPFPKPRGFWDYAISALLMTGCLSFLFWMEASDGVGGADAALALAAAVLFVLGTILARRAEKAQWIARPTWRVHLLVAVGTFILIFGAIYADAYLLHRRDLTANRLQHDIVPALLVLGPALWSSRRRFRSKPEVS